MDIILTSFGMGMQSSNAKSPFQRMPPLFLDEGAARDLPVPWPRFYLDYAVFFMFDRVIVDEGTYEKAVSGEPRDSDSDRSPRPSMIEAVREATREYAGVLRSLQVSGRLILKNFDSIKSRTQPVLEQAIALDLSEIPRWGRSIESSISQWRSVRNRFSDQITDMRSIGLTDFEHEGIHVLTQLMSIGEMRAHFSSYEIIGTIRRWKKRQPAEVRILARKLLRDYLAYINFNLILSCECQSPFIDWTDMQPLYEENFRPHGQDCLRASESQQIAEKSRRLFNCLFPSLIPKSHTEMMRAINDKRTDDLRNFVKNAIDRGETFDTLECAAILKEILRLERRAGVRRSITGWATLPLGFIPVVGTPIQKGAEELINRLWSNKPIERFAWYYLIDEIDGSRAAS
jgi:hypothetical protein